MLSSILFLMLGIRLHMSVLYYIVLSLYFTIWFFKTIWKLVKDDCYIDPTEDVPLLED